MQRKKNIAAVLKNLIMATLSLVIVVMNIVGYLSIKGVFQGGNEFNGLYNGLYLWELIFTQPDYFAQSFQIDAGWAFSELIPLILFSFALINFIAFTIGSIVRRYSSLYSVTAGIFTCAFCLALLFVPFINIVKGAHFTEAESMMTLSEYFKYLSNPQYATIIIPPVIGILQLIFAAVFCIRFGKKREKKEEL